MSWGLPGSVWTLDSFLHYYYIFQCHWPLIWPNFLSELKYYNVFYSYFNSLVAFFCFCFCYFYFYLHHFLVSNVYLMRSMEPNWSSIAFDPKIFHESAQLIYSLLIWLQHCTMEMKWMYREFISWCFFRVRNIWNRATIHIKVIMYSLCMRYFLKR